MDIVVDPQGTSMLELDLAVSATGGRIVLSATRAAGTLPRYRPPDG